VAEGENQYPFVSEADKMYRLAFEIHNVERVIRIVLVQRSRNSRWKSPRAQATGLVLRNAKETSV
jgi:hypothetical protein